MTNLLIETHKINKINNMVKIAIISAFISFVIIKFML